MKANNQTDVLHVIIEGQEFEWSNQFITGSEIKKLAGLPEDAELYLGAKEPWESEPIPDHKKVDLARPEIEEFFIKKKLPITINKKPYEWHKQYITGKQLKKLANIDEDDVIYLDNSGKYSDVLIEDDEKVNLARPGTEHFYSEEVAKKVTIIVNGTAKSWEKKQISFKEVIIEAYGSYVDSPTMVYTVGYEDGPKKNPEGSMTKGESVSVKHKMIFHATATDKS